MRLAYYADKPFVQIWPVLSFSVERHLQFSLISRNVMAAVGGGAVPVAVATRAEDG